MATSPMLLQSCCEEEVRGLVAERERPFHPITWVWVRIDIAPLDARRGVEYHIAS